MTNEEAIKTLERIRRTGNGEGEYKNDAQAIAIDMAIEALQHVQCFLDGPCEYQNKDIIVPSCSWCKYCNSEGVCAYWGTARVCEDTTPCSHYELDKQFFKEERTIER